MIAAVALLNKPEDNVSDYFPLATGTSWTYQEDIEGSSRTYKETAGNSQLIGSDQATPIVTSINGKIDGATFYRIKDNQVFVVAFDQNKPLESPYAILKIGKESSWDVTTSTQFYGEPAPLSMKASWKKGGTKEYFGAKREIIVITIDATIGAKTSPALKSHQVSTFAKGIGLVELSDVTTINKASYKKKKTLINFKAAEEQL